jgi:glycosyltransferase involved in cell wall biosynthesis
MSRVSIIITTYNMGSTLERAIDSVLAQTHMDLEVIVVDDGSSDHTAEVVRKKADKDNRVVYVHRNNGGISEARNTGIKKATGEFITLLDADDTLTEDSVEERLFAFDAYPHFEAVFANKNYIGKDGKCYDVKRLPHWITAKTDLVKLVLFHPVTPISHITFLYKREVFDKVGYFDKAMVRAEDIDFTLRVLKNCRVGYVDAEVYNYTTETHRLKARVRHRLEGMKSHLRIAQRHGEGFKEMALAAGCVVAYDVLKLGYEVAGFKRYVSLRALKFNSSKFSVHTDSEPTVILP